MLLLVILVFGFVTSVEEKLTVKSGKDAPLQCQAPTDKEIILVEWTFSELPKDDDVVFYWNKDKGKTSQNQNQNQAYWDRVELMDPQMTHGKVSVKLKEVKSSDGGTYTCRVAREAGKPPDLYSTIRLEVEESGQIKSRNTAEGTKNMALGLLLAVFLSPFS